MLNRNKLEKLTVSAYADAQRLRHLGDFVAMFNPRSFSQRYQALYSKKQGINTSGMQARYCFSAPTELNLTLVLDGTLPPAAGVAALSIATPVSRQVKSFIELTYRMNGDIHEPNFLVAKWGDLNFPCRLDDLNVSYTTFNRHGIPLRAELELSLVADEDPQKRAALENKSSPDLTHSRVVKSGDTLPLLSKEIYGSPDYYLFIAASNNLDDFRRLVPGTKIYFPPLPQTPGN